MSVRNWYYRQTHFNQVDRDEWVAAQARSLPTGARVLDVGAGPGPYRELFAHCEYLAQDFGQEPATQGCYTKLDYECDITAIPAEDESFDAILCTEVLEHVPDPRSAVAEMARLLKPGGRLILTAPLGSAIHQQPYHFYGGFSPYWYRRFLPEVGLEVESIEANRGFFSLFAQEALRFSARIDPRRAPRSALWWPICTLLWLATLVPFRLVLPAIAAPLDRLLPDEAHTIGYHVLAGKKPGQSTDTNTA